MATPHVSYRYSDNDDDQVDHRVRGWRHGILVTLQDGRLFELEAYEPTRLRQDIELEIESGVPVVVLPHVIVVPDLTDDAIRKAVHKLAEDGWFFDQISPTKA